MPSHSFCELGICMCLSGAPWLRSQTSCSQDVGQAAVRFRLDLRKDLLPSSFIGLLAGFRSLGAVGLRASVPCCLLAGGCPLFLATWTTHKALRSKGDETEREWGNVEVTASCNLISEETFHHFCPILFVTSYSIHSRGDCIRTWTPRGGTVGNHFRSLHTPTTTLYNRVLSFLRKGIGNSGSHTK